MGADSEGDDPVGETADGGSHGIHGSDNAGDEHHDDANDEVDESHSDTSFFLGQGFWKARWRMGVYGQAPGGFLLTETEKRAFVRSRKKRISCTGSIVYRYQEKCVSESTFLPGMIKRQS